MSAFVSLDGPDGCGKSTQALLLVDALRTRGHEVVHLREPGSTPFGERVRDALLDPACGDLDPLTEALAFSAARRTMLEREVAPARARGAVVVAERSFLSTVVYQCRAPVDPTSRADESLIRDVTRAVHAEAVQDLIVVLDVDARTGSSRALAAGAPDRIESKGAAFHGRVRDGFLALASDASWAHDLLRGQIEVIDAARPIDVVCAAVLAAVVDRLARSAEGA